MILGYRILTYIVYPIYIVAIFFRKFLKKEHVLRYKEKIFTSYFNVARKRNSNLIWIHAVSVGELKSVKPIIEQLNKKEIQILITTSTLSSNYIANIEFKRFGNVMHRFIPFDVGFLIENFLDLWKPNFIFLVDSEIWPNLILKAYEKKIPISLINARITKKTYARWKIFPKTAKHIFSLFNFCISSNLETKTYLKKLNVKKIIYNGNIKFINFVNKTSISNLNKKILNKVKFWVAASTHEGEDIFFLNTHNEIKKREKNIITIIAPRHIHRAKKIEQVSKKFNLKVQILNKNQKIKKNKEIIILNSFGELNSYFKYSKSVFFGKSLLKKFKYDGGQSPIDAAMLNCKVYHGPNVSNFKEVYNILKKNNISKKISNHVDLSRELISDFKLKKNNNYKSLKFNKMSKKILIKTMNILERHLNNAFN